MSDSELSYRSYWSYRSMLVLEWIGIGFIHVGIAG